MNTNGGFIYTAGQAEPDSAAASAPAEMDAAAPSKLSAAQLTRLTSWLDTALLELTRNQRRRHQQSSPLYTLSAYLDEAIKVLGVLASMSSAVPQGAIKVAYLLRLTAELAEGCAGYDVRRYELSTDAEAGDEDSQKARRTTRALAHTLRLFSLVDAQWAALLRSRVLDWQSAKADASRLFPADAEPTLDAVPGTDGGGRHLPSSSSHTQQDAATGQSSRTLSQTDRVRLRNVALRSRATLRDWAHRQLDEAWATDTYDERALEESEMRACEAGEERMEEGDLESSRGDMDGIVESVDEVDDEDLTSAEIEKREQERQAEAQGVLPEEDEEEDMEEVVGPAHPLGSAELSAPVLVEDARPRAEEVDDTEEGRHFADVFNKHVSGRVYCCAHPQASTGSIFSMSHSLSLSSARPVNLWCGIRVSTPFTVAICCPSRIGTGLREGLHEEGGACPRHVVLALVRSARSADTPIPARLPKLDPDASDAEDSASESSEQDDSRPVSAPARPHKRPASSSPSRPSKSSKPTTQPQQPSPPPAAAPSAAAEEGILIWDAAFAHVLSKTLRSLSDVADAQAEREAREKRRRGGGATEEIDETRGRERTAVEDD